MNAFSQQREDSSVVGYISTIITIKSPMIELKNCCFADFSYAFNPLVKSTPSNIRNKKFEYTLYISNTNVFHVYVLLHATAATVNINHTGRNTYSYHQFKFQLHRTHTSAVHLFIIVCLLYFLRPALNHAHECNAKPPWYSSKAENHRRVLYLK